MGMGLIVALVMGALNGALWVPMVLGWATAADAEVRDHYASIFPVLAVISVMTVVVVIIAVAASGLVGPDREYRCQCSGLGCRCG